MRHASLAIRVLLALVVMGAVGAFVLTKYFGMRVEVAGTGHSPIVTFHDPDQHFEAIERDREENPAPLLEDGGGEALSSAVLTEEAPPVQDTAMRSPEASAPWPDYRGAQRDGVYREGRINTDWPSGGPPELWRQKVGGGYASMVVAEGKVFTIEQRRGKEVAAAYDFETGRQVWEHGWDGLFRESMGGDGPRATPAWSGGRLYALGALGELRCLDASNGELLWKTNILRDAGAANLNWGMSASPLIEGDQVIVLPGGSGGKSVAAYHKDSGELLWTTLGDKAAYTAPQIETLAGRRQLLVFTADRIVGLDLEDRSLLWEHPWKTSYDVNSSQPIKVDEQHLWVSSGYGHGHALLRIAAEGGTFKAEQVWKNTNMKNKFNSSVLYDGYIYGLDDSIFACIDTRTGERKWKGGRYGFGQVLLADGHLIVLTERGEVVLLKATPERHEELASFKALDGKTWNVPAIAEGRLLVRNQTEMAAYDLRP